MLLKRASLLSVLVLALVMALAPVASAGEAKGPPGPGGAQGGSTPIDGFWTGDGAASICSFSGLNDVVEGFETTSTQSYGTFLVLVMKTFDLGVKDAKAFLGESPGHECNPTRAPWGNPKK
ncbi:MAG: hypothetical protein OEO77_02175 [Acidimicrobiia bacterium]|nr:hypothetical protein [Acidimicrobiia bacterium]